MKNALSILLICFTLTLYASSTTIYPTGLNTGKHPIIEHIQLTLSVDSEEMYSFFTEATFNEERGEIKFRTKSEINKITVFEGDNKKVYVLPVNTKRIMLGKSMFEKGSYQLVFEIADKGQEITTLLEVF